MNDLASQEKLQARNHDQLVLELIREVREELARMRADNAALETLDAESWHRTQVAAHNVAVSAESLKLGVLKSCARELEQFAAAVLGGNPTGKTDAVQAAMVAIETIDLELRSLQAQIQPA